MEHFEIIRMIGRGGMGEVYLARDTKLSRKVALKIVRSRAFNDRRSLERFLYEAKVTARFNHPHIVTAYSVGDHDGHPYVALEYLEGATLRRRMDEARLPVSEAIEYGRAIADALAEAHRHKILHRDLKPENVVLPPDGRLRVLDFGLAKVVVSPDLALAATLTESTAPTQDTLVNELAGTGSGQSLDTHDQGFTGTPYYMAPEQWQSEPSTAATDIWGLGVILYEMLAGERPFRGPTIFVLGSRVISDDPAPGLPPSDDDAAAAFWPELAALVARCLDKDAANRPTAEEVAAELRRLQDDGPRAPAPRRRWPRWSIRALIAGLVLASTVGVITVLTSRESAPRRVDDAGVADAGRAVVEPAPTNAVFARRMASTRAVVHIGAANLSQLRGSELAPALFWGLLHTDTDGVDLPVLVAERPDQSNGLARPAEGGGFEVTWRLRPSLKWSDGRPLTSRDVAFALEVEDDPRIVGVRTPDASTVVVTWDDQATAAIESIRPLPAHVLRDDFEREGGDAVMDALRDEPTPVVGPYRVAEFVAGERLVLEANPYFIGTAPSIPRVEVVRADPDQLIERFEAGQIDVILPDAISVEQAQALVDQHPEAVHIRPSNAVLILQPDLEGSELLKRAPARRALLQAIDRRAIVNDIFAGEGRIAHAPTTGDLPPGVETYAYDPAAARAAFAQLGDVAAEPLEVIHGQDGAERAVAERVAADLRAVGLSVTLREVGTAEQRQMFRQCRHGGLLLSSEYVSPRQSVLPFMTLPRTAAGFDMSRTHSGFNEQMATLVDRELRALIPERRVQLRDSLWSSYSRRLPTIPLVFSAERIVVHPALRGWDVRPGDRFGRGIEEWYFVRDGRAPTRAPAGPSQDEEP